MYKNNTSSNLIRDLKKPLLLQGPIGYFFSDLMIQFIKGGANPYKLNFNGGDKYFTYKKINNVYDYRGKNSEFKDFLNIFIKENEIDGIILFGDCRPLHKIAIELCKEINIKVFVFEEGYIRPNYVTLEINGVNANSLLMNTIEEELSKYKKTSLEIDKEFEHSKTLQTKHFHNMKKLTKLAILYWLNLEFGKKEYPNYVHHKDGDIFQSAQYWINSYVKKKKYQYEERNIEKMVENEWSKKYFLVALQVYNDSQIKEHSKFRNNKRFIYDTMKSFSKFGREEDMLIIKQHPLDIPYHNYDKFIKILTRLFKLENRVIYVHDLNLPILLRNSKGLVTINSTTGLSALYHQIPVMALGKAMYDIKGLCFQKDINAFWKSANKVNFNDFKKFRNFLIDKTQVVGSFYNEKFFPKIIEELKPVEKTLEIKTRIKTRIKDIINIDRQNIHLKECN